MNPRRPNHRFTPRWALLLLFSAGGLARGADAPPPIAAAPPANIAVGLSADDVRHHLGHVIDWYHRLSGLGANPVLTDDLVTRERLRQTMLTEVRTAFRFGRAAAPLVNDPPADPAVKPPTNQDADATDSARYVRMSAGMAEREKTLQAQIANLDTSLKTAHPGTHAVLDAQRAQLLAALTLTQEVEQTVSGLQQFAASSNSKASGEKGLLADISDMERTVPDSRLPTGAVVRGAASGVAELPGAAVSDVTAEVAPRSENAGLIAMSKEWLTLRDAIALHTHYINATEDLSNALDRISSTLTGEVRELLRTAPGAATSSDAAQLAAARSAIDAATQRFRALSTLLVPLGEESITLDAARSILWQRRQGLEQRADALFSQALLRGGVLVASILLIVGLSSLWRRATFRYLHDSRRRQQFLTLRRIVTAVALLLVVVLAFLTEIGSLATYIGFVTAGIAVALQNVILAVVAYFFLIGRYGVRVGDRITLAGVTGRVAEIGLVRLYLTELGGTDLHPTGRLVVLSNAVIFQPSALFKQIPGVDYTWHTATLVLDPAADPQQARARLQAAADAVYAIYRETIEVQLRGGRDRMDFEASPPVPEVSARFSEQGLEIAVRYPVMPDEAAQVDQQMSRALNDALEQAPRLAMLQAKSPT
jgi:small-conductance mechanosensitive channel